MALRVHAKDILLDCGNSAIKWSPVGESVGESAERAFESAAVEEVQEVADENICDVVPVEVRVFICGVNKQRIQIVESALAQRNAGNRCFVLGRDIPLPHCGQYATCGVDRLAAGIAAIQEQHCDLVVVDAGTMLTVTAWRYQKDAPMCSQFAGGIIAPGPQACLNAVHNSAPALPQLEFTDTMIEKDRDHITVLQHTTAGSISAAMSVGWPAMAESLIQQVCQEASIATVMISGGYASWLLKMASEQLNDVIVAAPVRSLSIYGLRHIITAV